MERNEQSLPESKVARIEKLEREILATRKQLASERDRTSDLKRRLTQMTRRRDELLVALEVQIQRAERFKLAYESLKSHSIIKLARAVLIPIRNVKGISGARVRSLRKRLSDYLDPDISKNTANENIEGWLAGTASRNTNSAVTEIGNLYRKQGDVRRAATIIKGLPVDYRPSPAESTLFEQVKGLKRLLEELPAIPAEQSNPGFTVNQGTVMYCAHSTGEFNSNGYSTRTSGLTEALESSGVDVVVAARPGYPWDVRTDRNPTSNSRFESEYGGVRVAYNYGPSWSQQPLDLFIAEAADSLVREALVQRPEIIVAASNHVTALPALIAARRLGLPFAYEVRGLWEITEASSKQGWAESDRYELSVSLETLVAKKADHVFAITQEVAAELERRGVAKNNISLLPNASDIYKFAPIPAENDFLKNYDKRTGFVLGYAGSLVAYEGLDTLIESVALLRRKHAKVSCVIVGDGPELENLKKQASQLNLQNVITFVGRVPSSEIPNYISTFDAVVCPRIRNQVTEMVSPLKPLEAMAAGKPVIGSDVAPIVTLLGDEGSRGVIFEAGNVQALSNAVEKLMESPKYADDIGRRARQWVVNERSWKAVASTMTQVLTRLRLKERPKAEKVLSECTVAIISDEFTYTSLKDDIKLMRPTPTNWRSLFSKNRVDALIVESAWEGNDGKWRRKVGYYDDEKCADLQKLVAHCRENGVPTIFWNKEDPVHFNRFRRTAKYFDHVFTTDASCIEQYWNHRGPYVKTIASLPFWAQPKLHNPLPTERKYEHTVAYGGSYYGERYAKRSAELSEIMGQIEPKDLAIYDRQFDNPASPYKFPDDLLSSVKGGLSYPEMVEAYKSHPLHINVNSVSDSPTMFSRRVFELAASGTPIVSGPSVGMDQIFGSDILSLGATPELGERIKLLLGDEEKRKRTGWNLLRTVFRSHLAGHRLAYMLRTAGFQVRAPELEKYQIISETLGDAVTDFALNQTYKPLAVVTPNTDSANADKLRSAGILVRKDADELPSLEVGDARHDPLVAEDLLTALTYSNYACARLTQNSLARRGSGLWHPGSLTSNFIVRVYRGAKCAPQETLDVCRALECDPHLPDDENTTEKKVILVAGHDLKFAGQLIEELETQGHQVVVDQWKGHTIHDEAESLRLLEQADIIFCEWSLGNVAWYSRNKKVGQRLVARFHLQELFTPYLKDTLIDRVDHTIFVGEFTRQAAIRRFGYKPNRTSTIANTVELERLHRPKNRDARFNLGLVGIVPQRKRLDLALDVLEGLRRVDRRYKLLIKGHRPENYEWMSKRPNEMRYYEDQYERIQTSEFLQDGVEFSEHGNDMAEWYQRIGIALSVSDFESFHYTLADGAASGAVPVSISWAGAEEIYPNDWISTSTDDMVSTILAKTQEDQAFAEATVNARSFAEQNFGSRTVQQELIRVIMGA